MSNPANNSPQIGVRFPPDEMDRLKDHAERNYAGNISTMVKVAVRRLMENEQPTETARAESESSVEVAMAS